MRPVAVTYKPEYGLFCCEIIYIYRFCVILKLEEYLQLQEICLDFLAERLLRLRMGVHIHFG